MPVRDAMVDPGDLDDLQKKFLGTWSWQDLLEIEISSNLTECITYQAPMQYSGGKDSTVKTISSFLAFLSFFVFLLPRQFAVYINVTNLDKVRVYINSPNQMLLTPTSIYGSAGYTKGTHFFHF